MWYDRNMKWAKTLWILAVLALVACSEAKRSNDPAAILSAFELQIDRTALNENLAENGIPVGVLMAIPSTGAVTVCTVGNFGDSGVSNAHCVYDAQTRNPQDFYLLYLDKETFEKRIARVTELRPGSVRTDDILLVKFDGSQREHWASLRPAPNVLANASRDTEFNLLAFDPVPSQYRQRGTPNAYGIRGNGAVFSRKTSKAALKKGFEVADGPREENRRYYSDNSNKDLFYEHTVVLDDISPTTVSGDSGGILLDGNGDAVAVFKWHLFRSSIKRHQYYLTNQNQWQAIRGNVPAWNTLVGIATAISAVNL